MNTGDEERSASVRRYEAGGKPFGEIRGSEQRKLGRFDCAVMNRSRRMFTKEGLLKAFLSLLFGLIVVYWPAIMVYLFVQTVLVGIHGFLFADGYKGALARGLGYAAIGVSVLVGVAVFVWETVIIIAAITRNL